jgi:hypothetical protein
VLVMNVFRALQRGGLGGIDVQDIFPLPDLPSRPPSQTIEEPAKGPDERRTSRARRKNSGRGKPKASVESEAA